MDLLMICVCKRKYASELGKKKYRNYKYSWNKKAESNDSAPTNFLTYYPPSPATINGAQKIGCA